MNPLGGQFGVQNFMSPYTQNVTSSLQALQKQNDAIQQQQLVGSAVGAGAFGGDRAAIAQSTLAGQQDLANNASLANVLQSGYGQALGAAMQTGTTNAQLGLGAAGSLGQLGNIGQAAYQSALGTGLSSQEANAWLASQGAFGMANLGQEAQGLGLSGANAQLGIGNQMQGLAQQQLNVPYQQFQQAQAFPYQISNFELGLATGADGAGSSGSTTTPGPSIASQAAGLGLTGLGLYNSGAFNGMGNWFGGSGGNAIDTGLAGATGAADTGWYYTGGARGGRIPHRALGGPIGYDDGGALPLALGPTPGLSPVSQAGLGSGNPMYGNALNQLSSMPTEKLRELQARVPPGSQQGGLVQAVLRRRQMMPQSDPALAQQPQPMMQGLGGLPGMGMASGGVADDDYGGPSDAGAEPFIAPDSPMARALGAVGSRARGAWQHMQAPPPESMPDAALDLPAHFDIASETAGLRNPNSVPDTYSGARMFPPSAPQPATALGPPQAPLMMPGASAGNVLGAPRGPLDIVHDVTGAAENSGREHGAGPMTSSGRARGFYQITDGTWRDFAPKAGVDLRKYPTADDADKDTQTMVADIIPVQRWDPRTVKALQAAMPGIDITQPMGTSVAGGPAAAGNGALGPPPAHQVTAAQDAQEAAPAPHGALGPPSTHGTGDWTQTPGAALMAAGLGILSGSSPYASVNIGHGALEGLTWAQNQKLRQQQLEYNQLKQQELDQYRQQMAHNAENRTDIYGQRVQSMAARDQAYAAHLAAQAASTRAENGHFSYVGTDGQGMPLFMDTRTGTMKSGDQPINMKPDQAARSDVAAQNIALRKAALAQAKDKAEQDRILRMTDQDLKENYKDLMGKPQLTPAQAHAAGETARGLNQPSGAPAPPPAPKVGDVVQGFKFLGGDPSVQTSWAPAGP
jgi:hypothetical protein